MIRSARLVTVSRRQRQGRNHTWLCQLGRKSRFCEVSRLALQNRRHRFAPSRPLSTQPYVVLRSPIGNKDMDMKGEDSGTLFRRCATCRIWHQQKDMRAFERDTFVVPRSLPLKVTLKPGQRSVYLCAVCAQAKADIEAAATRKAAEAFLALKRLESQHKVLCPHCLVEIYPRLLPQHVLTDHSAVPSVSDSRLVHCSHCSTRVRADRLAKHIENVHGATKLGASARKKPDRAPSARRVSTGGWTSLYATMKWENLKQAKGYVPVYQGGRISPR